MKITIDDIEKVQKGEMVAIENYYRKKLNPLKVFTAMQRLKTQNNNVNPGPIHTCHRAYICLAQWQVCIGIVVGDVNPTMREDLRIEGWEGLSSS